MPPNSKYYVQTMGNFYNLKTFQMGLWEGHDTFKGYYMNVTFIFIGAFNYDEKKMDIKKFLLDNFREKSGGEGA